MRRVRNALDRFRLLPFLPGVGSTSTTTTGRYVVWELTGTEQRFTLTESGERVTYDEGEA